MDYKKMSFDDLAIKMLSNPDKTDEERKEIIEIIRQNDKMMGRIEPEENYKKLSEISEMIQIIQPKQQLKHTYQKDC